MSLEIDKQQHKSNSIQGKNVYTFQASLAQSHRKTLKTLKYVFYKKLALNWASHRLLYVIDWERHTEPLPSF